MDEDELIERAEKYAAENNCSLGKRLGFGVHGIVLTIYCQRESAPSALKLVSDTGPYRRERDAYLRLKELRINRIRNCRVPKLVRFDDGLLAVEMTIVKPPFVLDYAGAFLDFPPEYPDEVWEEWERKNVEQFGCDWAEARMVLDELEELGIYMHDPSPGNIKFR